MEWIQWLLTREILHNWMRVLLFVPSLKSYGSRLFKISQQRNDGVQLPGDFLQCGLSRLYFQSSVSPLLSSFSYAKIRRETSFSFGFNNCFAPFVEIYFSCSDIRKVMSLYFSSQPLAIALLLPWVYLPLSYLKIRRKMSRTLAFQNCFALLVGFVPSILENTDSNKLILYLLTRIDDVFFLVLQRNSGCL